MLAEKDITTIFESFNSLNILVIGDVMIDSYLWGKADRISPEAPVPVVSVKERQERLGGAANVALNLQALGANPILCSVIGKDSKAVDFSNLLQKNHLSEEGIIRSETRITTVKFRIIASHHHMLRVDEEMDSNLTNQESAELFERISKIINERKVDAIIFEDYDKGVLTPDIIEKVVTLANKKNIPTAVDPKKRNFNFYHNVSLFKPNLKELIEGLKIDKSPVKLEDFISIAKQLEQKLNNDITLVTLSELGVFVRKQSADTNRIIPAHIRNIADVSGAGDTVISVATCCLALKMNAEQIAAISNLAGGLVCESVGVVSVDKERLKKETINLYCN